MFDRVAGHWNPRRLRIWLTLFFFALALPTGILVNHAWSQLKWESYYRHRLMAEELAARIDETFTAIINKEEARAFTDYAFLNVTGDPAANFLQRSPLSTYPVNKDVPGLIGYFQVDAGGAFSTPLLPTAKDQSAEYGVSARELQQREELQEQILRILSDNSLVIESREIAQQAGDRDQQVSEPEAALLLLDAPAEAPVLAAEYSETSRVEGLEAQSAFDQLEQKSSRGDSASAYEQVDNLQLDNAYADAPGAAMQEVVAKRQVASPPAERRLRKEQSVLPEQDDAAFTTSSNDQPSVNELKISIFESVVDAFELSLLGSGHLVLFRKVWRDEQRYIQGAVINRDDFINAVIGRNLRGAAVARSADLTVAHAGDVISVFGADAQGGTGYGVDDLSGELLFQQQLSPPLDDVELIFSINNLPPGPGGSIILWLTVILILILSSGCYLLYRLGLGQISLARQQQDFVSAVSHELKTPLTSIRMYGEMLREGWAEEDKKLSYYSYIHDESERLSRLINNVLQLARMTRNDLQIDSRSITVGELLDTVCSKLSSLVERAGFTLSIEIDEAVKQATVDVDIDCFTQILINLVDNSLKFAARSERKQIRISCDLVAGSEIQIKVRDFGPGIARGHMQKIFRLFYRPETELTRETVGTGIGLALVKQLLQAMHGTIDVMNMEPGAEFILTLPVNAVPE